MLILPPYVDVTPLGSFMTGPEGSHLKSAYVYPPYFTLVEGEELNTIQMDFVSVSALGVDLVHEAINNVIPKFVDFNEELLAYAIYEVPVFDVVVPDQVCLAGYCWVPPFAGQTMISAYHYRLWILSRTPVTGFALAYPELGTITTIAIILGIMALITTIVGVIMLTQGKVTWTDLRNYTKDILKAPGENIAAPIAAAMWPMAALGVALVAASLAIPALTAKATATIPIGPAQVGGEIGVAAAPPPRRRSR